MGFSAFLTKNNMQEWLKDNHKFLTLLREVWGTKKTVGAWTKNELIKQANLRNAIKASLGDSYDIQKENAERWALILKQKYTIMDAWSIMFNAMIAIFGIAVTSFTILSIYFKQDRPIIVLAVFILLAIGLLVAKYSVDKRSSWYKQLAFYLDSIAKVEHLPKVASYDKTEEGNQGSK